MDGVGDTVLLPSPPHQFGYCRKTRKAFVLSAGEKLWSTRWLMNSSDVHPTAIWDQPDGYLPSGFTVCTLLMAPPHPILPLLMADVAQEKIRQPVVDEAR